jgi:hypothetical protein
LPPNVSCTGQLAAGTLETHSFLRGILQYAILEGFEAVAATKDLEFLAGLTFQTGSLMYWPCRLVLEAKIQCHRFHAMITLNSFLHTGAAGHIH